MRKLFGVILTLVILTGCQAEHVSVKPEVNSVYYEIFVGSYKDSDGDGMGDLQGVTDSLDTLQELGVTGIWLMPISPSPTYHKYDVTDYKAIDKAYGTMEDFDNLVKEMKSRDMDLIIDLVLNHSSSKHPWFLKAVSGVTNNTCDEIVECGYYNFSDSYESGYTKLNDSTYYESVFWEEMPDLNLDNESLRHEIDDIVSFWIDKGVKGFRLDATTHFYGENLSLNVEFLDWLQTLVKSKKSDAYLVGEAWTVDSTIQEMYASQLDSFFNFGLSQNSGKIVTAIHKSDGARLAKQVYDYNQEISNQNGQAIDAVFLSNHDNNRSAGYLTTLEKQKMAASLYLLMPGNVFIYYGEELGMKGSGIDENKRLPMPWTKNPKDVTNGPSAADYTASQPLTYEEAKKDKDSLWYHYQKVINIRNTYSKDLARGKFNVIDMGNPAIYALEYDNVILVHNLSEEMNTITQDYDKINSVNGKVKKVGNTLELSAYTTIIIEK